MAVGASKLPDQGEPSPRLAQAYEVCRKHLSIHDPDRYVATLFAPAAARSHLFALYAFNAEIARVRETVSDVLPGEIRHQWWRDALAPAQRGESDQNPIAYALNDTIERFRLPREALLALIEARSFDLYDDPMPTWADLEGYCAETSSALIRLASFILTSGVDAGGGAQAGYGGVVYALTGLMRSLPAHTARGQCYLPHELLIQCGVSLENLLDGKAGEGLLAVLTGVRQRARDHLVNLRKEIDTLDPRIRPAFYPVCLCEPLLNKMERPDYQPLGAPISLSPLRRFFVLGRGAWRARVKH